MWCRLCSHWNSTWAHMWYLKKPLMIQTWFNFINRLFLTNESFESIRIYRHQKSVVFIVLAKSAATSMLKVTKLWTYETCKCGPLLYAFCGGWRTEQILSTHMLRIHHLFPWQEFHSLPHCRLSEDSFTLVWGGWNIMPKIHLASRSYLPKTSQSSSSSSSWLKNILYAQ